MTNALSSSGLPPLPSKIDRIWFFEIAGLTCLASLIHFLALRLVFPGYYEPFFPHHSDFYGYAAMAKLPFDLLLLKIPRPVGSLCVWLTGQLGLIPSIVATVFVTLANTALTASLFRRLTGIRLDANFAVLFMIYVYLVFIGPGFYIFYTHDLYCQYSYFFLIIGAHFFYYLIGSRPALAHIALAVFACLSFLSKETYALSALFFATCGGIYAWRRGNRKTFYVPFVIFCAAFAMTIAVNSANNSPFTSNASEYKMVLSIPSVAGEMWRYMTEAVNWLTLTTFGTVFLVFISERKNIGNKQLALKFSVAGIVMSAAAAAWVPNAMIPGHHMVGYAWNGAYLLFLPLLMLGRLWGKDA